MSEEKREDTYWLECRVSDKWREETEQLSDGNKESRVSEEKWEDTWVIRVKSREWVKKDRLYLSDEYTVEWKSLKERRDILLKWFEWRVSDEWREERWYLSDKRKGS